MSVTNLWWYIAYSYTDELESYNRLSFTTELLQFYIILPKVKLTTVSEWCPSLKYSSIWLKTCVGSVGSQPAYRHTYSFNVHIAMAGQPAYRHTHVQLHCTHCNGWPARLNTTLTQSGQTNSSTF